MINELFSFQQQAVNELRMKTAIAMNNYRACQVPQVISLQAPTGSGKTIIMAAFVEDVFFGSEQYTEQPDAVFVWLSDSPQLNEQSRQKFEQKADRLRFDQYVTISDDSLDQEVLDDGKIYFLNTQKLGKGGNLGKHSDTRQFTIWETIENTALLKADRLYFIIDEAHRGMMGNAAGTATSIMQRFIKGDRNHQLSPVPVIIGMSATAERFDRLIGKDTNSTLQKVIISPSRVRASGLLKDRIVITYPEDPAKYNEMVILQAATDEWREKCQHWYQYTFEQHYTNVNPVFVIQVKAGSGSRVSDTNLDDVIAKVEERIGDQFKEGEVVHTFGSTGTLIINGLNVPHIEPSDIVDNRKIKIVLFKENLSTGWDCPRAETMMSFRVAEDATYIAQLLGRMIRTPLQCHVVVDESLNDVRLFLPYFNKDNVKRVIDELQSTEGGEIPAEIDGESFEDQVYVPWSVHVPGTNHKTSTPIPGQKDLFDEDDLHQEQSGSSSTVVGKTGDMNDDRTIPVSFPQRQSEERGYGTENLKQDNKTTDGVPPVFDNEQEQEEIGGEKGFSSAKDEPSWGSQVESAQQTLFPEIDRESVIKFINEQGFLTYQIRMTKVNSYLKSLLSLAGILTQNMIFQGANEEIKNEITDLMRTYIVDLKEKGKYDVLAKQVLEFKLSVQIFDPFGEKIENPQQYDLFEASETDLDRQLRAADAKLGGYNFPFVYGRRFIDFNDPNAFKIDCILFAADEECIRKLNVYAEAKFHALNDKYRKYVVSKSEKCRKQYSDIVANGDIISKHNFTLPEIVSARVDKNGDVYRNHLYADTEGNARIKLNGWEKGVLREEEKREDFVCWLRNFDRQSWSLRIPCMMDSTTKTAFPDLIVIRKDAELGYVMDILEPHSAEFKDNLGKAKGFAEYAEEELRIGRIQLIRMVKDASGKNRFKRLDMERGAIRAKVLSAMNNDELDHIFDTDGIFED